MSEKTFKVGDRVRVNSERLLRYNGKVGDVVAADNENLCSVVEFDGESAAQQFHNSHLEHEPQPRLPQVGEVWKTRNRAVITKQLEYNPNQKYPLFAECSDGVTRAWKLNGGYGIEDTENAYDLVEFVSESQPEPTPELQSNVNATQTERYVTARGKHGWGVVDLESGLIAPSISASEAEDMCERFESSGPSIHTQWVKCSDAGVDVDAIRKEYRATMGAQTRPSPELEVSVEIVPLVSIKDEATGISIDHDAQRDVLIDSTLQQRTVVLVCPTLDEIAALARCFAKLHEILSKEAAK